MAFAKFTSLRTTGWWTTAALVALVVGVLWAANHWLQPTPQKHLVLAGGPERGAYEEFARRYRPALQTHGVTVQILRTQGSNENLAKLRAGEVQAAFVQGGVGTEAAAHDGDGTRGVPLLALGSIAREPLWVFYREDRWPKRRPAPDGLAAIAAMKGWRIDIGPPGSGTGPLVRQLAAASGVPPELLRTGKSTVDAVVDLVQGRVDAVAMVSSPEAPLVQYLLRTPGVALVDFAQAEAYARRFAFLQPLVLPRGVVDLATDEPPRDVRLVAATAALVVRADLHPALMQLLLQAARDAHGGAGWFHRAGDFPGDKVAEFPLAPEAERFYRNGPPWLQRYLPFWLANFVDRMWVVLLPLLAVLLPLSRVLPPLVELRLRSRVFRWYANLRQIEQSLEKPGADLGALRDELERLDAQTERIGVPLSYANELYDLRGHIHLVRKRIALRGAPPAG